MIGLILSGGQSTRMGQDKGLMEFNGRKWTEVVRNKLASCNIHTYISINQQQLNAYSALFNRESLVLDNSELKFQGPLLGLASTHLTYPTEDILAIGCDMIYMESIVVEALFKEFTQKQPEAMAYKGEHIEPLCAVYSARGLNKIMTSLHPQENQGMRHVLEALDTIYLPIKDDWRPAFKNFNKKADLH